MYVCVAYVSSRTNHVPKVEVAVRVSVSMADRCSVTFFGPAEIVQRRLDNPEVHPRSGKTRSDFGVRVQAGGSGGGGTESKTPEENTDENVR